MISKEQLGQKDTSDWPSITENQWYALAITSAIFTAIAIFAAFLWIFVDGFDGDPDLKNSSSCTFRSSAICRCYLLHGKLARFNKQPSGKPSGK